MTQVDELETRWLALGRSERELTEAIGSLTIRIKNLRSFGSHDEANELADVRAELERVLKGVHSEITSVEPKYFAARRALTCKH